MKTIKSLGVAALISQLIGCGSLSGFDANSDFACKAPPGVLCQSMSGIYANAEQKNLPGQRVGASKQDERRPEGLSRAKEESVLTKPIYSGTPIRSAPRVLRVWFAPWEDGGGDLHDQNYVYLAVDPGRWLIEHNRRRIQDAYRPVHAQTTKTSGVNKDAGITGSSSGQAAVGAQGMENIGVVQGRPSIDEAAAILGGIKQPGQINQPR